MLLQLTLFLQPQSEDKMPTTIIKSLPYVDIIWDDECNSIISQWKGGFSNRDIKTGLNTALQEFIKKRPNAQWIGDTTNIGVIPEGEQEWINKDWFPRFLATGVKFMAVVQPASAVAKMSVNSVVSTVAGTNLTVFNCASLKEAQDWMKRQKV